jgi:hypothetical protein
VHLFSKIRASFQHVRRDVGSRSVICDRTGVSQIESRGARRGEEKLSWEDIAAAFAYKRDCFSVDQIRVALVDRAGQVRVDVSENDEGYDALVKALPNYLRGCLPRDVWFTKVAFPPFETCLTELYRRAETDSADPNNRE